MAGLLFLFLSLLSLSTISLAADTMLNTQLLTHPKTLISTNESFEMGFFNPGQSKKWYLGIWYKKISNGLVVWVANRDTPMNDSSGSVKLNVSGSLVLLDSSNRTVWSSIVTRSVQNPVLQLLDSGNLVVRAAEDQNSEDYLWQSFDYPTDTHLPGMKLGKNTATGKEWYITSWKSKDDPGRGPYKYWMDLTGYPQIFMSNGSTDLYRSGPWNGLRYSGTPSLRPNPIYTYGMYFQKNEVYYRYDLINSSVVSRFVMLSDGMAQRSTWIDQSHSWSVYRNIPTDICNTYKLCGPNGVCNVAQANICGCLSKFVPKSQSQWNKTDWSGGCVRRKPLSCQGDGFIPVEGLKLPDTRISWHDANMTLQQCRDRCLRNCSCTGYATLDIGKNTGCLQWFGDLFDITEFKENGQELFVRVAASELANSNHKIVVVITVTTVVGGLLLFGLCIVLCFRRRKNEKRKLQERLRIGNQYAGTIKKEDIELSLYEFDAISNATNDFSIDNKLGEGGFGPVYKGTLEGGQEIAVKRLSRSSRQGIDEFKNEVLCIAKLQHRNLVKLLGCCIHGEEKMLIYEFMPNKSLDAFIFDERQSTLLDWPKRFHIINGIASGILYLHQDSRLRIIHRDLKASNILLDKIMNPKISDFGLARSFGGNDAEGNTNRVVGTYGYMSPEYAVDGLFSVKLDVFSFGVLVLEIVSGKRNRGFSHRDHNLNLLGHAWKLHREGRSMELVDTTIFEFCYMSEILRSIQVGLLCVQQNPDDRPTMSNVVLMLGSEGTLPLPKQPGFFTERNLENESGSDTKSSKNDTASSKDNTTISTNDFTITIMEPR